MLPSEFDYWETPSIQSCVVNDYVVQYNPIASLRAGTPIEFYIPGSDREYIDLNSSRLEVKLKVVDSKPINLDIANQADHKKVSVINLTLHSLFSHVSMELGDVEIADANGVYPYRAYLETILSCNANLMTTRLPLEGFWKDTGNRLENMDSGALAATLNEGFKNRIQAYDAGALMTLSGRPHLDLFHQEKDIPSRLSVKLRFTPSSDAFVMLDNSSNGTWKPEILNARMFIRKKLASPSLLLAHEQMLNSSNMRIAYNKVLTKHHAIAAGTTVYTLENAFLGTLPDRVFIAFVRSDAMSGTRKLNPFNFQAFGLTSISLNVNGEQVPRVALEPDFAKQDYEREYWNLLEVLDLDQSDTIIGFDAQDWCGGYGIYGFRISSSPLGLSVPTIGSIRVDIRFGTALANNINMLMLSEQRACLEIDKHRNVLK